MVIKMPSSDVAADMCSSDSLSLTGLICNQEKSSSKGLPHEPNYPRRKTTKVSENEINFEFSYSEKSPVGVKPHKKSQSSDLFELKLNQESQTQGNVTMKDVLEPRKVRKPGSKREVGRKNEESNGGFAKLMQSITTPCRSCSAVEPSATVNRTNTGQAC